MTMRQIAQSLNMDHSFAARTLQLANLAPDKLRRDIPDRWEEQRKLFLEKY